MADNRFLWKPVSDSNGRLVVLTPTRLNNQIAAVQIISSDGTVIDQGRFDGIANGDRSHFRFNRPGGAYQNVAVRVVLRNGSSEIYNIGNGSSRVVSSSPSSTGSSSAIPQSSGGLNGSPSTVLSDGNVNVSIPSFVDFNPADYFISAETANAFAKKVGQENINQFLKNFDTADDLTKQTVETELSTLENFIPRSSALVRKADKETNQTILSETDVFDARNEKAVRRATEGNVELRGSLFDEQAPEVRNITNRQVARSEADQQRIRQRAERSIKELENLPDFIDPALADIAVNSARNEGADRVTAGGFGAYSSASRNFLDRVAFDQRLDIEERNREERRKTDADIRAFENDINLAEENVRRATGRSTDLYNSIIAPGIVDFSPQQPSPEVTDIGEKIPVPPARDGGSIRTGFTQNLSEISTLSPATAFQGSFDEQKYNSGVGLQALAFEQDKFNTISAAENNFFDKQEQSVRDENAQNAFTAGLDTRNQSETISSIGTLLTSGVTAASELGLFDGLFKTGTAASTAELSTTAATASSITGSTLVAGGEAIVIPATEAIPAGYTAIASAPTATGEAGIMIAQSGGTFYSGLASAGLLTAGIIAGGVVGYNQLSSIYHIASGGSYDDLSAGEKAALAWSTFGFSLAAEVVDVGDILDDVGDFLGLGSGKNTDQLRRDGFRELLEEEGVAYKGSDGSHRIDLADGTTFDIGKDGNNKLDNAGKNIDGKTTRYYYDVDHSQKNAAETIGYVNPLSAILFNSPDGNKFVGHLTNAVMSSNPNSISNIKTNIKGIALDAGVTYDVGLQRLEGMKDSLPEGYYDIYKEGWYQLYFGDS